MASYASSDVSCIFCSGMCIIVKAKGAEQSSNAAGRMGKIRQSFDALSLLVILVTLVLFVAALFLKGLTHDLLLEAGVFLVSVKLILMSYKQGVAMEQLRAQIDSLHDVLQRFAPLQGVE